MEATEIRSKSLSGAKWTFITSAVTLPLVYFASILLARISPEVLGLYATVTVFIGFLVAFILFGGNVFAILLPGLSKMEAKNFLSTYGLVEIIIVITFIIFQTIMPTWWSNVVPTEYAQFPALTVRVLTLLVVGTTILVYILRGIMEIALSSLLERGILIITSILLICLVIFFPDLFTISAALFIGGTFILAYLVIGCFALARVKNRFSKVNSRFMWYLPQGFWRFATFVHIATITTYLGTNLDRLFLLGRFDIGLLGIYYGIIQIATYTHLIPKMLSGILPATVSNSLQLDGTHIFQRLYGRAAKIFVGTTAALSIGVMYFSPILMSLYGERFIPYKNVLILLTAGFGIASLGQLNAAVLLAEKRSGLVMSNSIIFVAVQFIGLFLARTIYEVALAKVLSLILAQFISIIFLKYIHRELKVLPTSYLASIVIIPLSAAIAMNFSLDLLSTFVIYFFSLIMLFIFGKYSIEDIRWLKQVAHAR